MFLTISNLPIIHRFLIKFNFKFIRFLQFLNSKTFLYPLILIQKYNSLLLQFLMSMSHLTHIYRLILNRILLELRSFNFCIFIALLIHLHRYSIVLRHIIIFLFIKTYCQLDEFHQNTRTRSFYKKKKRKIKNRLKRQC